MEMEAEENKASPPGFKVTCRNYPSEFILDKNLAKEYFKQFGKLKRVTFKPKQRICTVEYANRESFLNALSNAGEYKGEFFKVTAEKSPVSKKKTVIKNPLWLDSDELKAELEAMSGTAKLFAILEEPPKSENTPKLKRTWHTENTAKKKGKETQRATMSSDQLELINLVKSQATSLEDKFRILDARDKLIRIKLKKNAHLKSSATVGTCPDMCPEKERLMRETRHQVALYEQEDNGRSMNPVKAVKQYSRSSADQETPLPHELRPVSVLQMTIGYLMHNIIDLCDTTEVNLAEWFHFLWDRTRGIRKDITQQELCCQGAVELVEQCARFHIHCSARLVAEDPSVFDQKINTENLTKCLQSLKYMYHDLQLKGENCPNEAEFRAYIILLNLNDGNFMWEVQELRQEIQKSKEVKFALGVYSALDKNNYVKFFKLVYETTYLSACILMRYFVQVRITAIKTLLKCYTARARSDVYPLNDLTQLLGFDDIESTIDFMQAYGISINEEKTHIILEKNTFMLPEFPYLLERSFNVVESKRTTSVGMVVCGKELPPKTYENHALQNSFDDRGYLNIKDMLDDSDLDMKFKASDFEEGLNVSDMDTTSQPLVVSGNNESTFGRKPESFGEKSGTQFGSIFAQANQELPSAIKETKANIFVLPKQTQSSVSSQQTSMFGKKPLGTQDQTDSLPPLLQDKSKKDLKATSSNIFAEHRSKSIFGSPTPPISNIFGAPPSEKPPTDVNSTFSRPGQPKGGFTFNLPKMPSEIAATSNLSKSPGPTVPDSFSSSSSKQEQIPVSSIKMPITPEEPADIAKTAEILELERRTEEEERERRRKELEEQQRKIELEKRKLEEKKREEERLKAINKRMQEEELRRRMEELRREEEQMKNLEIERDVTTVLNGLVSKVVSKMNDERLEEIKCNIRRRKTVQMAKKWRETVLRNKRKRKAMDCSPVGITSRTVEECAHDFYTASQDLTLNLRKRYRYGKPLDIELPLEDKVTKIDLFKLTYPTLNRRIFELRGILQNTIFWKVGVSLPDHYELRNGLNRLEETLKDAFQWEDRNNTIMAIEQVKPNPMQTVTYCVERQRGLYARYADSNGLIFIAKDFNSLLQRRILENLKDFGVFTKVPIVIILQEYDRGKCDLKTLIEEEIVSDYIILVESLTPTNLVNLVEEALIFLAGKVEKQPPLELDTLQSFAAKYLCVEVWKRASSFAKWNSQYKNSLRNPNIVISLYNEALGKIKKIVLNKSCSEYATFPEVFRDYLNSEIPDCLPCNYYYFPKFWKSEAYISKLEEIIDGLTLPKWQEKWPPANELDLEVDLSKYCVNTYSEPEKPFYNAMSVLLRNVDPNVNFEDIRNVLWTDVIEVLGLEKLRQSNLSFTGTPFETKSVFNQYFVVYHVGTLEEYQKCDWFYLNHPLIKRDIEQQLRKKEPPEARREVKFDSIKSMDLDKIIADATKTLSNKLDTSKMKKDLAEFNALMDDLESSIKIHKRISSKIGENLKRALED